MSPIGDRINAVRPEGRRCIPGFHSFRRMLSEPGAAAGFASWSDQMMTRMVADTIRDFILNQPIAGVSSESAAIQFGITQGLEMAYQLLTDPSILVPGIYGKGTQPEADGPVELPDEGFDTPADGDIV